MYTSIYSDELTKKLEKLKKREPKHYETVRKKIDWILENPDHDYKNLRHNLSGTSRVHIGHFVLIFVINNNQKTILFDDYDHHDKIYQN